jgi:transcriptional regulator with XRE-family HTH domain
LTPEQQAVTLIGVNAWRAYLQQQMDSRRWRQADLARASGLTRQHISGMMTDDRERLDDLPTRETVEKIAKAFGVSPGVVLRIAAEACGVPVDGLLEVSVSDLSNDVLIEELRRRLSPGGTVHALPERKQSTRKAALRDEDPEAKTE